MELENIINNLNSEQKEAVTTIFGPVLVIAGPGTGKTQVLAARIAYILQNKDVQVNPSQILCLTYTEAGVIAMRQRLISLIGSTAYKVQISTFHGFCNNLIQNYPDKFPRFAGSPKQASDLVKYKTLRQILSELDPSKKWHLRPASSAKDKYAKDILSAISFLKKEGITPANLTLAANEYLNDLLQNPKLNRKGEKTKEQLNLEKSQEKNLELAHIYAEYDSALKLQSLYDYDDMILEVVERLHKDEDLAYEILEKLQFILVDEYQDTNGAQNKILKLLGSLDIDAAPNIFAVGDDDQAIYSFQGANISNILFFQKQFPQTKTIVLTKNYRSTQPILDLAAQSIDHNSQRLVKIDKSLSKNLIAANPSRQEMAVKPEVINFEHSDEEIAWVAERIQSWAESGKELSEIAVIYRTHADAKLLSYVLDKLNIPTKIANSVHLLDMQPILKLLQLLNVVSYKSLNRDHDLVQLMLQEFLQIGLELSSSDVFNFLTKYNDQKNFGNPTYPIRTIIELGLSDSENIKIQNFFQTIVRWQQNFANMPLAEALIILLEESGFLNTAFRRKPKKHSNADLHQKDTLENIKDIDIEVCDPVAVEAINNFVKFVREQNLANPNLTLEDLLLDLQVYQSENLQLPFKPPSLNPDSVNLLTAHSAKGLEFEHVIIFKAVNKTFGGRADRSFFKIWPPQIFSNLDSNLETLSEGDNTEKNVQTLDQASLEETDSDEEERRLFFVAMTRAKSSLTITYSKTYRDENGESEKQPSVFVEELNKNLAIFKEEKQSEESKEFWLKLLKPIFKLPDSLSNIEKTYLQSILENFRLSASALNEYLECPLKFKFNRLLKIPTVPTPEIALGNALHKSLEIQSKALMAGQSANLELTKESFVKALSEELLSREDFEHLKTQGEELLTGYYETYSLEMKAPAGVEYNFGRHNIMLDLEGQDPICLTGKIDKLEWVDKESNRIRIVDYKTSVPKTENAIRGNTKDQDRNIWQQVVFYNLMARLDDQFKPVGKMQKYIIEHTRIDFLKPDKGVLKQVDLHITKEDEDELVALIGKTIRAIRNLDFAGSSEYPLCGECEFCKRLAVAE